ncbi:MAG: class I SAM-dependent rRNA methyltransferase [Actinomycetota bacterium]
MEITPGLPEPSEERLAVHVSRDALRQIRGGHPWLWDGSIERLSKPGRAGDLAVVFDDRRKFAAIGLYDPHAPIAVRILHQGSPRAIDAGFFDERLLDAFTIRQPLIDDPDTTAYRLVHGENDRLPGLVVDRYEDHLVLRLDTIAWLPHLRPILERLIDLTDATCVILRTSRRIAGALPAPLADGMALIGETPRTAVAFREHGLAFTADIVSGQKTGHFLDQRANRQLVATRCTDADVLDVFCNTGGFTVAAAAYGARSVHSIDLSAHAIDATRHHVAINRDELGFAAQHTTEISDAFEAMERLADQRRRFDVAIVDPPSFAPNAASVPGARRAYRRLTALALELLGDAGTLFQASCSSRIDAVDFHDLVADEIDRAGCKAVDEVRTTHAIDHPSTFEQGAYLKAVLADIRPRR